MKHATHEIRRLARAAWLGLGWLLAMSGSGTALAYNLVVQPIQSPETTRASFQPLIEYLREATGAEIQLVTARNFVGYWQTMKKGDKYDLVLDAAHFTDYRAARMGYTPLVKIASVVSLSLVTHEDNPVFEARELIGKPVALLSSPSMDAVRLAQLFPNPLRQPVIVRVDDSREAAEKVRDGKAVGALVPTPMVGAFPFLYTVVTTEQVPHMALSAAPSVPKELQDKIRDALLKANETPKGRELLQALNFEAFEPADAKTYKGYGQLLQGVYGY